ncbi:MAG: hydrogenase, partial [Fibrobacter sp.]|nr:hydrogenase [Fibrobacter sp.]
LESVDFEQVRGFLGVKESTIIAAGKQIRVAVISGLANVEPLAERIIKGEDTGYDLIEVMACPGGCICGAGHPVPEKIDTLDKRQQVLINIDKTSQYRKSQENPDILRLYDEFYGSPNSPTAHSLLHTEYRQQSGDSSCANRKNSDNSVFVTHEFVVCACDSCVKHGALDLFSEIHSRIKTLKMEPFISVKSIRTRECSENKSISVTLDGKKIEPKALRDLYKSVRESI